MRRAARRWAPGRRPPRARPRPTNGHQPGDCGISRRGRHLIEPGQHEPGAWSTGDREAMNRSIGGARPGAATTSPAIAGSASCAVERRLVGRGELLDRRPRVGHLGSGQLPDRRHLAEPSHGEPVDRGPARSRAADRGRGRRARRRPGRWPSARWPPVNLGRAPWSPVLAVAALMVTGLAVVPSTR
jgi:hypothetical protein